MKYTTSLDSFGLQQVQDRVFVSGIRGEVEALRQKAGFSAFVVANFVYKKTLNVLVINHDDTYFRH